MGNGLGYKGLRGVFAGILLKAIEKDFILNIL